MDIFILLRYSGLRVSIGVRSQNFRELKNIHNPNWLSILSDQNILSSYASMNHIEGMSGMDFFRNQKDYAMY